MPIDLQILFIDDEPEGLETILQTEMENRFPTANLKVINNFSDPVSNLLSIKPDVIVLDLMQSGGEGQPAGNEVLDRIWNHRFCPVVIYSAHLDIASPDTFLEHPFIESVQKGRDSEVEVFNCIESFKQHIDSISQVEEDFDKAIHQSLRDVAPLVFHHPVESEREHMLVRAARRHVAANMDEGNVSNGSQLASWEHYISPPISSNCMIGDVIRRLDCDRDDPENYFLILSPSCDMTSSDSRSASLDRVLVAKCEKSESFTQYLGLDQKTNPKKKQDKLVSELSKGYVGHHIPLPALPSQIPTMTANLKNLDLIDLNAIANGEANRYFRVASVDSPFREMISWAYLQTAGRPGLPSRNLLSWADEIIASETPK